MYLFFLRDDPVDVPQTSEIVTSEQMVMVSYMTYTWLQTLYLSRMNVSREPFFHILEFNYMVKTLKLLCEECGIEGCTSCYSTIEV